MIYINLFMVAVLVVFIVDISGFTDTILDIASKVMKRKVISLRPFTCSLCATWWVCLAYALIAGAFTLPVICWCAFLAAFAQIIAKVIMLVNMSFERLLTILLDLIQES